jgi:hypothetical protein
MILYHFTSRYHIESIKIEGITKGQIPMMTKGKIALIPGYQWLTENLNYDQEWCKNGTLKYDRSEFRITLKIPRSHVGKVINWIDFCKQLPGYFDFLNTHGDPWNWRLFEGRIKPGWFMKIDRKLSI